MRNVIVTLLIMALFAHPTVALANGDSGSVGNPGGSVEYEIVYVSRVLKEYVSVCAAESQCALSAPQKAAVRALMSGASDGLPSQLRFYSEKTHPGMFPLDSTGKPAFDVANAEEVLINVDRLYAQDSAGGWHSLSYNEVIAQVVRIAAERQRLAAVDAAALGAQVARAWSSSITSLSLASQGWDSRLMAVGETVLFSDNAQVSDLGSRILAQLPCANAAEKPVKLLEVGGLYWESVEAGADRLQALAGGDIRYRCKSAELSGKLRLALPLELLPGHELRLLVEGVKASAYGLDTRPLR